MTKFKRNILSLAVCFSVFFTLKAQEQQLSPMDTLAASVKGLQSDVGALKKIKISGYIQPQFQWADSSGIKSFAGGDFPAYTDKRFKVRRAEIKTMYDNGKTMIVANIDITQNGIAIKDAYGKFTEQSLKAFSLTAGIFNRPFGFEVPYSSGMLESPERGRMSQTIFPGERDLGAMITFQLPKTSSLHPLKIEGGMFNGTGNNVNDFDYQKDFIGNIHWNKSARSEKLSYGIGVSAYSGGWRQGTSKSYTMAGDSLGMPAFLYTKDTANFGAIARRQYGGFDGQLNIDFPFGMTTLRAEYIAGQQPGTSSSTASPSAQPATDTYFRNFNGAYLYFLQSIGKSKHQLAVKYDWYDPNTDVSGDEVGKTVTMSSNYTYVKTNGQDIKYTTLGLGWIYHLDQNVKITLWYDMVKNETSANLNGFHKDIKDNVLTLRVQYKF